MFPCNLRSKAASVKDRSKERRAMARYAPARRLSVGLLSLVLVISLRGTLSAITVKIHGMITARSGTTLFVQTSDSSKVMVLLTDETQVGQIQGVSEARRKELSMAALIPGLEVQVEGTYDGQNRLVAKLAQF